MEQKDTDAPLVLSISDFNKINSVAGAWKSYGFDLRTPEQQGKLDVSKSTVDNIRQIYADCYNNG